MKTTLDLPTDLVREMKLRAVHEGKKLKEVASEVIRLGLREQSYPLIRFKGGASLPLIRCPRPATPGKELTPDRVAEILLHQELP